MAGAIRVGQTWVAREAAQTATLCRALRVQAAKFVDAIAAAAGVAVASASLIGSAAP